MKKQQVHALSAAELEQNLCAIEEKLKTPVDQKTMRDLFKKLETAQEDCDLMKSKCSVPFFSKCEERIRSLFGTVVTTHVDSEVEAILQKANHLSPSDSKSIKALRKQISVLKSWHRPSKENLLKIDEAEGKLGEVQQHSLEEDANPFEAIDLLELASSVYHKNKEEINKLYHTLSSPCKKHFQKHLGHLKTKAFEKRETTIQALFAAALEMAGSPPKYPTRSEITEFFEDEPRFEK
jgi:hypothetical protein